MGLNKTCWACEHGISSGSALFCPSCDAIQPLDLSVDHFTIFGIERSFKVDPKMLERRYKNLQKKLHPDLMSSKSQNHSRIQDTEKVLETSFAAGDFKKAASGVQRLAYYTKVEEEIVRKL